MPQDLLSDKGIHALKRGKQNQLSSCYNNVYQQFKGKFDVAREVKTEDYEPTSSIAMEKSFVILKSEAQKKALTQQGIQNLNNNEEKGNPNHNKLQLKKGLSNFNLGP